MAVIPFVRQTLTGLTLAAAAGLVLAMAWPRMTASLYYLPVERAIDRHFRLGAFEAGEFGSLRSRAREAIAREDRYRYHAGLSLLEHLYAASARSPLAERRASAEAAIAESLVALGQAPVQPDLWLRIPQVGGLVFWPSKDRANAWKMAVYTGRVETTHFLPRLQLGYALRGQFEADGLRLLADQTMLAWHLRPRDVQLAIRRRALSPDALRDVMAESHPDVLAEMERLLAPAVR